MFSLQKVYVTNVDSFSDKIIQNHLLGHFGAALHPRLMLLVLFLLFEQFISGLLGEKFDGNPLVLHSDLRLSSHISSRHGITHAPRPILIFLDGADKLVTSFDINLAGFDDFL